MSDREFAAELFQDDEENLIHQGQQLGTRYADGFIESRDVWKNKNGHEIEIWSYRDRLVGYTPDRKRHERVI